jgi:F420-dependent oxidoreductase-like protein
MRAPITLDLHIPNFNYPDVPPERVFDRLVQIATTAEAAGFSSISLMDHLHQIPGVGPEENWMFEGNTMLAALAARTSSVTLGLLVGGVTYRNPALLAKITTTLDVISKGRAWLGIGAAWFEGEHRAYGFDFPPLAERFGLLEEALQVARAMFTQPRASFAGERFRIDGAYNNPRPLRGDIPIVIGGSGERKTLRLVARYADGCNLFGDPDRVRHLLGVLAAHCEDVGRDPAQITKTGMGIVTVVDNPARAQAIKDAMRRAGVPAERVDQVWVGSAEEVAQRAVALREAGLEGMTLSIPDVHDLQSVERVGRALAPVFA